MNAVWAYIRVSGDEHIVGIQRFHMPPTNITLAQAQRVKQEGNQGKLL